jgi:hypothetical protein
MRKEMRIGTLIMAGMLCTSAFGDDQHLVLARRGEAATHSIRVEEGASSNLVHAARELSRYIRQLTDVDVPLASGETALHAICLAVKPGLGRDAFRFRTAGDDFHIEGDDERAVLFGVYDFLENYCDCDWLTPDQDFVPHQDLVQVPRDLDRLCKPAFAIRDCYYSDARERPDFAAKLKLNEDDPFDQWLWKCHTFTRLMPPEKYFKEHPEYYALVKGERKGEWNANLCLTNPDVLRIVTSNLLDRIAKVYPEKKVFGVSQSDCWDHCECESCTAIDRREESPAGSNLAFVNAVAEAVAKKYPDVIVETLAYQYTVKPPKHLRPRDNVMVCLCTDQCDFSRPLTESRFHSRGRYFVDDLRTWCAITGNRVHLWDYTMNFQYKLHAFPNIYSLKGNLETFLDCGVTEVFEQGPLPSRHQAGETLKLYLLGHLLWNPRQPLKPLLSRFYNRYYGEAGLWMRRYMEELHAVSRVRNETEVPLMMWGVLDSPALPTDLFEHGAIWLEKAAEAVKDDPVKSRNVRWERNANDYTRIMRSEKPTPELAAAAARILEDWKNFPDAARISESSSICDEARTKLEQYAAGL